MSSAILPAIVAVALLLPITDARALPGLAGLSTPAASARQIEYRSPVHRHRRYRVNRYGYGHYVHGPNGSYGGYPAGSAGARELQIDREQQCRYSPESC